jgi:DNA repair protein RecN (Recombination protein N)
MISELSIRGLGVIDSADVEMGPNFTVVTGETGAGKTMVLTAVGMLLGARPASGLVRGDQARVEGRLLVAATDDTTRTLVSEVGGHLDEDSELILTRVLPANGRAKAFAGGAAVPAAKLAEISSGLVAIHGQSDQLRLRQPARQRALLDAFAGGELADVRRRYKQAFTEFQTTMDDLVERVEGARARRIEAESLRHGLDIIAAVAPEPGEDDALRAEEERLANTEDIVSACQAAHRALSDDEGDDDALARIAAAVRAVEGAGRHDDDLARLATRLQEVAELLADAAADLASYTASVDDDPARLAWVQQRRSQLAKLTRTYGPTVDDALSWAAQSAQRLIELDGDDERIVELQNHRDVLTTELSDLAAQMSMIRAHAAAELEVSITAELQALAMPDATVSINVSQVPDEHGLPVGAQRLAFTAEGVDQVAFLLAPHRGATPAPLGQGASGGELSRVMLALEVALAGVDATPTMVFDEVDAGVGGKAAVEIGRRLARLARHTQVVVVTHLPQVAAFADTHLVVSKGSQGTITSSNVHPVKGEARRREIARMLAGQEESDHALAHADELLSLGRAERL